MVKRIAALLFIFVCTTVAWIILGVTIFSRTYSLNGPLGEKVSSSWGSHQSQRAPTAAYSVDRLRTQ